MNTDADALYAFIRREVPWSNNKPLDLAADLRGTLRMIQEDVEDLLPDFFREFHVDPGDFDLGRYFTFDAFSPICFWRKEPELVPLTLGMLLHAAHLGIWNTAEIEAAARR